MEPKTFGGGFTYLSFFRVLWSSTPKTHRQELGSPPQELSLAFPSQTAPVTVLCVACIPQPCPWFEQWLERGQLGKQGRIGREHKQAHPT